MTLTFLFDSNPVWEQKIQKELQSLCNQQRGKVDSFKSISIYATSKDCLMGGIIIEYHDDILWIDSLWVEADHRRQGVGKLLLEKAYEYAASHNLKEIQLNTFFPQARDFFLAQGFQEVATLEGWKYGLTCYFMKKII